MCVVASLAEAWIEIVKLPSASNNVSVASLAEAWIEISKAKIIKRISS